MGHPSSLISQVQPSPSGSFATDRHSIGLMNRAVPSQRFRTVLDVSSSPRARVYPRRWDILLRQPHFIDTFSKLLGCLRRIILQEFGHCVCEGLLLLVRFCCL